MLSVIFQRARNVILLITCISVVLAYAIGKNSAVSFLLGASISLIPTLLFGWIFFKSKGPNAAKKIVHAFYIGETIKILITIILFTLVFQWPGIAPLPLFLGFITAQMGCLITFFKLPKI